MVPLSESSDGSREFEQNEQYLDQDDFMLDDQLNDDIEERFHKMEVRASDAQSQAGISHRKRCGCMIAVFAILAVSASILSAVLSRNTNVNNTYRADDAPENAIQTMDQSIQVQEYYEEADEQDVDVDEDEGEDGHDVDERQRERPEEDLDTEEMGDEESEEELEYESVIDEVDSLDTSSARSTDKNAKPAEKPKPNRKPYTVLTTFQHDPKSFTQGLTYANDVLYESTGLYRESKVRKLDPVTGEVLASIDIGDRYFGEGMAYIRGANTLLQITWKLKTAFVYDADTLEQLDQFKYETQSTQGWGITHMPERNELAVSDGSSYLHFWSDSAPYQEIRRLEVRDQDGEAVKRINELEYVNGWIFANIWQTDVVIQIDPSDARVVQTFDFKDLWPKSERDPGADVLNGISIIEEGDAIDGTLSGNEPDSVVVYMTGKLWPEIYVVELTGVPPRDIANDQFTVKVPDFSDTELPDEPETGEPATPQCDPNMCFEVLGTMKHDVTSFTQGLTYFDGTLYESTGIKGSSKVRKLDPNSGDVLQSFDMDGMYFGEGMTYFDRDGNTPELVQITWKAKTGIVYDAETLEEKRKFMYSTNTTQGWGITYIPEVSQFVVSDGSEWLHFWDASTDDFKEVRRLQVVNETETDYIKKINELEYVNGAIFANIWYENVIIVIDPDTGKVLRTYDFEQLWPMRERPSSADCLNGISVTDKPNELLVTGKWWPQIYRIRFLDT